MDLNLLKKHIALYTQHARQDAAKFASDLRERVEMTQFYRDFSADRLRSMNAEVMYDYLSRLWAMRIWGNKHYAIDKILDQNGLEGFRNRLAELLWGKGSVASRWDSFRAVVKGVGPAMMSELLCKTHPSDFILWNRRAYVGLRYLKVDGLPRYDYQLTGDVYTRLCDVGTLIAEQMKMSGIDDTSLLAVDYFVWEELQVEDNLSRIHTTSERPPVDAESAEGSPFIHNDVRDKLRDIGQWLGFSASVEQKVSDGSRVDTVWEATIGNMGRVMYVFEVQTAGSIDSLIINLLKSLNNPAVQGIVAVSDRNQLERIQAHARGVVPLRDRLKYWEYDEVLRVHEGLEFVNERINALGLVPQSF